MDLDNFQVENKSSGQPYWVGPDGGTQDGCLSISHRAGQAFCAVTYQAGACLGADLELVEARDPIFLEDYLGPRERELALACQGGWRDFFITLAWSAKEAAFKALGTGLRMDTRKIQLVAGLECLATGSAISENWQEMELAGEGLPGPAQAFWMKRGDFILSLVVLGDERPILHEV